MEEEADDRDWDFWGEADDVGPTTVMDGFASLFPGTWRGCTAPYVAFDDQSVLRGDTALLWFADHGVGPDAVSGCGETASETPPLTA